MNDKNEIQKSIECIGEDAVTRYLPKGMKLHDCPVHGKFVAHYKDANPICPLCSVPAGDGNGTTASQVELFINLKNAVQKELRPKEPLQFHTQDI